MLQKNGSRERAFVREHDCNGQRSDDDYDDDYDDGGGGGGGGGDDDDDDDQNSSRLTARHGTRIALSAQSTTHQTAAAKPALPSCRMESVEFGGGSSSSGSNATSMRLNATGWTNNGREGGRAVRAAGPAGVIRTNGHPARWQPPQMGEYKKEKIKIKRAVSGTRMRPCSGVALTEPTLCCTLHDVDTTSRVCMYVCMYTCIHLCIYLSLSL